MSKILSLLRHYSQQQLSLTRIVVKETVFLFFSRLQSFILLRFAARQFLPDALFSTAHATGIVVIPVLGRDHS